MKINAQISIIRCSNDVFIIRVEDEDAVIKFLEIEMTPHDFAMAISGLSCMKAKADVRGLGNVGKRRVYEGRSVQCPMASYSGRENLEQWIVDNCQEDGWIIRPSLGSQSSVSGNDDGCLLKYSVVRWEEIE